MKNKIANPVLMACILIGTMILGTGIYQHMFGIPEMLESPAAMDAAFANDRGQPQFFWMPLHGLYFITLILSLISNWKSPNRKKLLLIAAGIYLYISIISIVFAKQLFVFKELPDAPEFYERTKQWIALSWHRVVLQIIASVLLLIALSRPKQLSEMKSE